MVCALLGVRQGRAGHHEPTANPLRDQRSFVFTHMWSMTFNDAATPEKRDAFVAAMRALPEQVSGIESFRSGTDLGLNPGNADVVIVAEFADESAWRSYLEAPAHVAFIEEHVTPLSAAWTAIQFDPAQGSAA
jgi:hypothetical protein